jgi:hypothetical protein
MRLRHALALLCLLGFATRLTRADEPRAWEINGIRLEASQVERLAGDIAAQTVTAVSRLEGLELRSEQARDLESIYRELALDVYGRVVVLVAREDLSDGDKEAAVKTLVLEGQERSSARVRAVLDPPQYAVYQDWERRQVEAFKKRGLWSGDRRRARSRP